MAVDLGMLDVSLGPTVASWTEKDVMLYALGVGAGSADPDGRGLGYTTENCSDTTLTVLPTFATTLVRPVEAVERVAKTEPGMRVAGSQSVTLAGMLPVQGQVSITTVVTDIADKVTGALVTTRSQARDVKTGLIVFVCESSAFLRGCGGFAPERRVTDRVSMPASSPTEVITYETSPDQALFYRLSGDRNPLHSDPTVAARVGFARPILHGLCTYGFVGRALLHSFCDSDPGRFRSMSARFSAPVYPGESLRVSMWDQGANTALFRAEVPGRVVIDDGILRYNSHLVGEGQAS